MSKETLKKELHRAALLVTMSTTMSSSAVASNSEPSLPNQTEQTPNKNNTIDRTSASNTAACSWQNATSISAIIADAEKNGYLPKVELSGYDKWLIEERQATLEERMAQKTKERNQEYLKSRQIWGERYALPESFIFGNWNQQACENYDLRVACADKTLPQEEQLKNKKKLAELTEEISRCNTSQIKEPVDWKLKSDDIVQETKKEVDDFNQAQISQQLMARSGKTVEKNSPVAEPVTNYSTPLAYLSTKGKIFVNKEIIKEKENTGYKTLDEAAKGNPAAMNCLIYHELNHKHNWDHDGLGQLSYTPVNAAKGDVLTEKLSLTTEYLHMVKEYNDYKAKGKTTVKYDDGTEKPLDSLLEIYPGLKETVEKYGTDVNNPQTKRQIVAAAMNYWEQDRGHVYEKQTDNMMMVGNKVFNRLSFSQQMDRLRNEEETYKKVSQAMLSNINIGDQQIDLKDCQDLIDTFTTEDAKDLIKKHNDKDIDAKEKISIPTYQEYQEINAYLESIGKTTDTEKMEHIAKTIQTASTSIESYDKNLENIILKHNPQILSGFLSIERTDDKVVATCFGKKYDITEYATPAQTNTNQKASTLTTQQLITPQKQH